VGCGTGHHIARYRAAGYEVSGVDGSEEMLARARALNPGTRLEVADVESLPFAEASFDAALSIEVLRYLPSLPPALREVARVLRPGGVFVATAAPLLNLNGYWLVNRVAAALPVPGLTRLRQFFVTSSGLRSALVDAGFERVEVHGVYIGPVNWVQRLVPGVLPRVLRAWEPWDARVADGPLRELSNMFVVRAVRAGART
jgi:SAM-dependent methyltransferase